MKTPPGILSEADLQRQRATIRRGLVRANTAAVIILLVVVGLAAAAILQANRAARERVRAEQEGVRALQAEQNAREKLWKSYLDQARGSRASVRAGHRFEGLEAVRNAAAMRPSLELRNEALACLALADLRLIHPRFVSPGAKLGVDGEMNRYAIADEEGNVQVREVTNDQLVAQLPSQTNGVAFVSHFSPNGQFVPVFYRDGVAQVWDLAQRRVVVHFRPEQNVHSVDFSPDSRSLVVVDATRSVVTYDLAVGSVVRKDSANTEWLRPRFSPDGQRLGMVSEISTKARLLAVEDGRVLAELPHRAGVRALAWSPDSELVATACNDGRVYVWNSAKAQPVLVLAGHQGAANAVAFHPKGQLLASASWDGTTRLWDVTTGELLVILPVAGSLLRFSRDGRHLSFYGGKDGASVYFCEVACERVCQFLSPRRLTEKDKALPSGSQYCVAFSPDGRFLAAGCIDGWRLWDADVAREIVHVPGRSVASVLFHPDGRSLFTFGEEGLFTWPMEAILASHGTNFSQPQQLASTVGPDRACLSAGGEELAFIRRPNVHLLKSKLQLDGLPGLTFIAMSRDSQWLAASSWGKNGGRLWQLPNGKHIRDFAPGQTVSVDFSPDSRFLITGDGEAYRFWEVESGRPERTIAAPQKAGAVGASGFSPDGKIFACASSRTQVQFLDGETFEPLAVLESPAIQIISWLAFNSAGTRLAVGTSTPFIQLWDLRLMRQELAALGLDWGQEGSSAQVSGVTDQLSGESGSYSLSTNFKVGRGVLTAPQEAIRTPQEAMSKTMFGFTVGGVGLCIVLSVSVLRRHKTLVESYRQIDDLAIQRSRELEVAQIELLHSEKMKALGTLAAGIAHDFNNLLSVIRLSNDLIGQETQIQPSVQEEVRSIENAVKEGRAVVRSMLGYSRSEEPLEQGAVAVADLVAETVSLLSKEFLSGILLTLDVAQDAPPAWGVHSRLEQILLNLIVNAAEAMNGQGKLLVAVRARRPGVDASFVLRARPAFEYVELQVTDSGPGIAPEILPRIFEPFFTTKVVGTRRGTGLGLSLLYALAEQDGLGLGVETALGKGTTFRVVIPAPLMPGQTCDETR